MALLRIFDFNSYLHHWSSVCLFDLGQFDFQSWGNVVLCGTFVHGRVDPTEERGQYAWGNMGFGLK